MNSKNSVITFIAFLVLGLAIVASAVVAGNAYKYKFETKETIKVTGLGKKDFQADLIIWNASYQTKHYDLASASQQLSIDKNKVRDYLVKQGIQENQIVFSSVDINRDFDYQYDSNGVSHNTFVGYTLHQSVEIKSENLAQVEKVSREISELISNGIELNSSSPNYYFSGLEDLKLELISQATANARKRAENIANESNASLGDLIEARMGIFQITGQYSNEDFTYGGVYNTTSKDKTANITVNLEFKIN